MIRVLSSVAPTCMVFPGPVFLTAWHTLSSKNTFAGFLATCPKNFGSMWILVSLSLAYQIVMNDVRYLHNGKPGHRNVYNLKQKAVA